MNAGFFSGFWVIDTQGSWNGSVFTVTVSDSNPHFLYAVAIAGPALNNCSKLAEYRSDFTIPLGSDVIFALNPVLLCILPH
jgi:hypothetical protein